MATFEEFIQNSVFGREVIDVFLDPAKPSSCQFDPELGYVPDNFTGRGGMENSLCINTVQPNGARKSVIYADQPCRINSYGDSFTQSSQVNDHESWQEYLAAHLAEPIRNFGVGGYGVYQAYRRMIRTEAGPDSAENILFYIWGDDHLRSALRCRHVLIYPFWSHGGGVAFHCNFWSNLELDLTTGQFVEKPNLLPTPEALYKMTDADFMVEALRDDWMLQLSACANGFVDELDTPAFNQLADILGHPHLKAGDQQSLRAQATSLRDKYAFAATNHIVDLTVEFAKNNGKKVMFLLFCPQATRELIQTGKRYEQPVVDHLQQRQLAYVDVNVAHAEDYKNFSCSVDDYMNRFLIGHYNPIGNHFFAFALRRPVIDWLDPKPVNYR